MRVPDLNWPKDLFHDVRTPLLDLDRARQRACLASRHDATVNPGDWIGGWHMERELADAIA